MEAVTILKNESNNHRLIQIDLDELEQNEELIEDIIDIITVEMRRNEESTPWEEVKNKLNLASK